MAAVMTMKGFSYVVNAMSEEAYCLVKGTLRTCCVMLLLSLALLLHTGGLSPETYSLYRLAAELESSSAAVLLWGNAAALFLERCRRR